MSAQIYVAPEGIERPNIFDYLDDRKEYTRREDLFYKQLVALAKKRSKDNAPEVGELISFPVADGKAHYVVMSMKPLELIHVDLGDAYEWQYVNLLTPDAVREEIRKRKALERIFSKAKKDQGK